TLQEEIRKQTHELSKSLDVIASGAATKAVSALETKISSVKWDVASLQESFLHSELERAESGKRWYKALDIRVELLERELPSGLDWRIAEQLEGIREILKNGYKPSAETAAQVSALLDKTPASFSADIEAVRSQLKTARGASS